MKRLHLGAFLLLLLVFGCSVQDETRVEPIHESKTKFNYNGKLFDNIADLKRESNSEAIYLFNDYSTNKNLDYVFDSEANLLKFISETYDDETAAMVAKNFTQEESETESNVAQLNSRVAESITDEWSDFNLQFYNTYCNTSDQLCFLDPYYFPTGQINNISSDGCGYYAKSFGVKVPANGKMSLTYYKYPNCSIINSNPYCFPHYRTTLFNPGSYCVDVWLGSCSSSLPALIKSAAVSAKWSCSRTS